MNDVALIEVERSPAQRRASMLRVLGRGLVALERANTIEETLEAERQLDMIEQAMQATGLFRPEQIREANEGKFRAGWKLGRMLRAWERQPGQRSDLTSYHGDIRSFKALRARLNLDAMTALRRQRIGALPAENDLEKVLARYRGTKEFLTYNELINFAKPHWYIAKRHDRHEAIVSKAKKAKAPGTLGPFALIYLDPPWVFETYHPKGNESNRLPDDHYPTMTDDEIVAGKFHGKTIQNLAHTDCAMFMWCTSSNLKRALTVMERFGFEFKTSAVWDKEVIGMGLVFRNQHELLLYGERGSPPKPIHQPSSVFRFRRGKHSAKPPEIRATLEKMYPKFTAANRVEIFARGTIKGWTSLGHEAANSAHI